MFRRAMKVGLGVLVVLSVAGSRGVAAEKQKPAAEGPDQAAMEKMMEEFAKPGPEHAEFKDLVGNWKAEVKSFWEDPKKPQVSTGSATFSLLLGGRYLQQKFKCSMGGESFEGLGISAYDKAQKKYVSIWIDNMGTGIMRTEGKADKAAGTFTEFGEASSPMGKMKTKMVSKTISKDKFIFTMFMTLPGGTETKSMEITYTRQ